VILAIHRLALAVGVLSATLDRSGGKGGIAPLPSHVPA